MDDLAKRQQVERLAVLERRLEAEPTNADLKAQIATLKRQLGR